MAYNQNAQYSAPAHPYYEPQQNYQQATPAAYPPRGASQDPYQQQPNQNAYTYDDYGNANGNGSANGDVAYGNVRAPVQQRPAQNQAYPMDGFYRGQTQSNPKPKQPVNGGYDQGAGYNGQQNAAVAGFDFGLENSGNNQPHQSRPSQDRTQPAQSESPAMARWDSPFPNFPGAKKRSRNQGSLEAPSLSEDLGRINLEDEQRIDNPQQNGRPPTAGSKGSQRSTRSRGQTQNGQTDVDPQGYGPSRQQSLRGQGAGADYGVAGGQGAHVYNPKPYVAQQPYQNEPQRAAAPAEPGPRYPGQAVWQEPAGVAGYYGPEDGTSVPQRPATAASERQVRPQNPPHSDSDPQNLRKGGTYQQQHKPQESFDDVLDAYYGYDDGNNSYAAQNNSHRYQHPAEEEMPNFDAVTQQPAAYGRGHENDLHLPELGQTAPPLEQGRVLSPPPPPLAHANTFYEPSQQQIFAAQVQRSKSQPDLRGRAQNQRRMAGNGEYDGYDMAGHGQYYDVVQGEPQYPGNGYGPSNAGRGGYGLPRGRGGSRFDQNGQPIPRMESDGQYYPRGPPGSQQQYPSGRGRGPPGGRGRGPMPLGGRGQMQPGMKPQMPPGGGPGMPPGALPPMPPGSRPGGPQGRLPMPPGGGMPGGRGPPNPNMKNGNTPPGRQGSSASRQGNPDLLPQHPAPVRPGLMPDSMVSQNGPPPPVRQYNGAPSQQPQANQAPQGNPQERRMSGPVTYDELERLKQAVAANPQDMDTQLTLAKKWVEAASVLADEGGRADVKTRNRNREKYIFDAHKLIKKLVSANHTESMFYLADCYGRGLLGLEADQREAFNLYQSAAKLGHAASAYRTAVCCEMGHEEGGGTKKDPLKAIQWYKRAAALGDTPAMYKMGIILLKGLLGQQRNPREAIVWLKRAAERADEENPHALHELGLLYESAGGNDSLIRDEHYAGQLFTQAAEFGYKFSQFRLGCAYEYGTLGFPIDPRQSIVWYSRAAVQGEHQSELALSGWYLTGSEGILQQSDTEAYLWARKAAQAGLAKAEYALGYFTEVGIGTPANVEDAKRWYWRAAAQNFPKARERLEEMKKGGTKMQRPRERYSRSNMTKENQADCVVM